MLPLHGGLPPSQQSRVFNRPPKGAQLLLGEKRGSLSAFVSMSDSCYILFVYNFSMKLCRQLELARREL